MRGQISALVRASPDKAFEGCLALAGLGGIACLLGIILVLTSLSADAFRLTNPIAFLTGTEWDPVASKFGALPALVGTLLTSAIALAIAVPFGLATAVFLSDFAPPRLRLVLSSLIDMLAAIPSVIYGLWGLYVLAPLLRDHVQPLLAKLPLPIFQGEPVGLGIFCAGIVVSIMILPIVISVSREVLMAVPNTYREAALALGATKYEVTRHVLLPSARSGLFGAAVLGLGRALGETMAVTMVVGNRHEIPKSLFDPGYTLAAVIANEFTEAFSPIYLSALAGLGLILVGTTFLVNTLARLIVWRMTAKWGAMAQ